MGLSHEELHPPLDDIAFLSRSNNRIAVLQALEQGERTRGELRDETGVSRPTMGRILSGFEDRGWVTKNGRGNGHEYVLTSLGGVIAEEFSETMVTVETVQQLRELAPRIPFDELNLDPRDLADARITTPSETDATAHMRRERELLEQTNRLVFLCNQTVPETVDRYRDWAIQDERELEAIITGNAIEAVMEKESMVSAFDDILRASGVTIYRYDGQVSAMLGLFDELASIVPLEDSGVPCALVESDNETVRAAVTETLSRYQNRAKPVTVEDHSP